MSTEPIDIPPTESVPAEQSQTPLPEDAVPQFSRYPPPRRPRSVSPYPYQPYAAPGAWDTDAEDQAACKKSTLGHEYKTIDQIWDPTWSRWVTYIKPPPVDYGNALFVARNCTYQVDDPESAFCVVEFKNEVLTQAVREIVKDVEGLFATPPSARTHSLFPHLPALHAQVPILRKQAEDKPDDEHLKTQAGYLASFLEFMDTEWEPMGQKLERLLADESITYELLWAVFKPGMSLKVSDAISGDMMAARLTKFTSAESMMQDPRGKTSLQQSATLVGSTRSWNGTGFSWNPWSVGIQHFKGTKKITSLFVTELKEAEKASLTERGRKYVKFAGINHVELSGVLFSGYKETLAHGRAMIDATNRGIHAGPQQWDNNNGYPPPPPPGPIYSPSPYGAPPGVPMQPPYGGMTPPPMPVPPPLVPSTEVPEDELYLLPPTLPGYSLVIKEWGSMRVSEIEFVQYDDKAWDHLILDANTKTLIRSLVEVRGDKKKTAQLTTDWVRGKSGGLVFLLHGDPGLGKTLSAETVAEDLKRPLYVVGASELGFSPQDVEHKLRQILDTATFWNAVLLLDEADVLLERRSQYDLQRNALVASALRLLEYHTGVLFLTTNRVQSFDPAFLSRVSIAIKYSALDFERRAHIWRQFLFQNPNATGTTLANSLISEEDVEYLAVHPLNGRVIKNIVRTAQSLALASDEPLSMEHLKIVIDVTNTFLKDMEELNKEGDASTSYL